MITILVIVLALTTFSIYQATTSLKSFNINDAGTSQPPSKPNGNSNNPTNEPPQMNNQNGSNNMTTPPDKPDGETSNSTSEPSEKPDNDTNQDSSSTPPEMPSGNNQENQNGPGANNNMNQMSSNTKNASLSTIYYVVFTVEALTIALILTYLVMSKFNKYTFKETFQNKDKVVIYSLVVLIFTVSLTYASSLMATKTTSDQTNQGGVTMPNDSSNISYNGNTTITDDQIIENGEYSSSTADENAIIASSGTTSLSNIEVTKTGDSSSGDNTSFYGTNSAILAKDGANLTISNANITTSAKGANGVFSFGGSATTKNSTGNNTTINISDSKIVTTEDNSGGIMTTGGGIMNATNLDIKTSGTSSAAIRSDRGGGTVTVNGGTYKTTGQGSPTIYSTADITVKNATLSATASEGIVIEGKNSVNIDNCTLTDTNNKLNGLSTTYKNIFLYQSMSGDADTGVSTFTAKNSTITTNKGDTFYITNTSATINLENNQFINNDTTGNFLTASAGSWGTNGSNGGTVTLNLSNQTVKGNIEIDDISTLTMNLTNKSSYEGAINNKNEAKSITLKLSKNSKLKLTGDTYLTSLDNEDTTNSNIDFNGYKLYINNVAIN